ncbi:MAG TPA: tRNA lysidine(34) synthetase TilS [Luteimicrobium sp.]|nr:tRNA lysidine(34) synthetase TilS [Luteimicrobium sp.]
MAGPTPSEAAARVALRAALADLPPGALVLVACSGGADSLALAATAAFVAPRAGLSAGAVVVDHGLQPGSDDVAATAARACRGLGLEPVEVRGVVVGGGGGPEAAARDARYAALEDAAREHGAAAVLLAHTLDDQAETVLLGLARGSGSRSLAGMPPVRGVLRRPFLGLRRADTEAVCRAVGLTWWDDPTNGTADDGGSPNRRGSSSGGTRDDDPRRLDALPLRSRVRTEVLPELVRVLGPGVPAALARTAAQLRDDADVLDALAADLLARAQNDAEDADAEATSPSSLDVRALADAPRALRTRALRLAATRAGSPGGALTAAHVEALDALVVRWRGQGAVHLPGPVLGARECGRLVLRAVGASRNPDPGTRPAPHP